MFETAGSGGRQPPFRTERGLARDSIVADPDTWGADGNVVDIARQGNTLYLAGSFRSIGRNSGGLALTDGLSGDVIGSFPKVTGSVHAIVPDGTGGWYIGGSFTAVGGKPRSCLAQIRRDGSVTDWDPSVTGSPGYIDPPVVGALAVSGGKLFVGGGFREIGGAPHRNFGCVELRTGSAVDWNLDMNVGDYVYALAANDSIVFVGGWFDTLASQPRLFLGAIDTRTGNVHSWRPEAFTSVEVLLLSGNTLYVGGRLGWIAGVSRSYLAAVDIRTAQALPFDARLSGVYRDGLAPPTVSALAMVGDTLYVGGSFTEVGGVPRPSLVALDATTGAAYPWTPPVFGPVYEGSGPHLCTAFAVVGDTLYIGGSFQTANGENRPAAAAVSRATGALFDWNPRFKPYGPRVLVVSGGDILAGGELRTVGEWRHRAGLAAVDLTTGELKPWNPNPDGGICNAIVVRGDRVYVSGDFATIGGNPTPRSYLAALDTLNGEVTDWNPGANSIAIDLLLDADTLYAGGLFTQVGGQPRNRAAALSAATGEVLPWDPNVNAEVWTLAKHGRTVYLGGTYNHVGGLERHGLASVDATTGVVSAWNPGTDNDTGFDFEIAGNTLYFAGAFHQIAGVPRKNLAAFDLTTGELLPLNLSFTNWGSPNRLHALAMYDSLLVVGGIFGSVNGAPRVCLAAVDTATGQAIRWDPDLDGLVFSLHTSGGTLFVGGGFNRAGGYPLEGVAAFSRPAEPPPPPVLPQLLAVRSVAPNPARGEAVLTLALPQASTASLAIFDVAGRRVAQPLDRQLMAGGATDLRLDTSAWREGVYFCRLEAGGQVATRRFTVLR